MILKEKYWRGLFETGILIKFIVGIWEIVSGLILLLVSRASLNSAFLFLVKGELVEDPQDALIHFLSTQLPIFFQRALDFAVIYLFFHGFLNIFLAYNLFKKRLWAYVVSIIFSFVFIFYFVYLINHTHSLILVGFIAFDILFMILTWHEYRYRKKIAVSVTQE